MSELCLSSTSKSVQFSRLLLSHLFPLFSFFLSQPLYSSYFLFFSPCLLKLLSFLSPLFFTTSILLLALPTISPAAFFHSTTPHQFAESKLSSVISAIHAIREKLHSDGDFHQSEAFEAFRIALDPFKFDVTEKIASEISENKSEDNCRRSIGASLLDHSSSTEIKASGAFEKDSLIPAMEERNPEAWFVKEFDEFGNVTCITEEKKVEPPGTNSEKVVKSVRIGSEAVGNDSNHDAEKRKVSSADSAEECVTKLVTSSGELIRADRNRRAPLEENLGSFGSMRKDKEWKRTLACKLFEDRKNVESEEGMDMLWETYELDSGKRTSKKGNNTRKKKDKEKKITGKKNEIENGGYEEREEEDEMVGPLCCLQALKMSTGKMNLGMGKSNLGKISKAIKGIGWFHNVTTRHAKKGCVYK